MRNVRALWSAMLLLPLLACNADRLNSPFTQPDVEEARARWDDLGLASYTVEMKLTCFCVYSVQVWHVLRVENDQIVAVTVADPRDANGNYGEPPRASSYPTVDRLFEMIEAERARPDRFLIERYDTVSGMPVFAEIGTLFNDAGIRYELRRLRRVSGS